MIRQVPVRGFDKNLSYLISDEAVKETIVVDPVDSEQLIAEISFLGYLVKAIFLTHSHSDHLEGVNGLVEKYNVPVYIHKNGVDSCKELGIKALPMPSNYTLGSLEIITIHTPGHTQDSVCFYVPKIDSLITGDTVFVGSVGRANSVSDMKQLYSSISFLRKLPPRTLIFPGHDYGQRPVGVLVNERKTNLFLKARNFYMFSKLFEV